MQNKKECLLDYKSNQSKEQKENKLQKCAKK